MKKFSILFIALTFLFTSCFSDDDDGLDTSADLVGTWIGVDIDLEGSYETSFFGETIKSTFIGEAYDVDYSLVFSENPNEVISNGSYSIELTTVTYGQTQVTNSENNTFLGSGTWSRDGNQLTIIEENETSTATILELTATTLKMAIERTEIITEQGISYNYVVNGIATYVRQD